MRLWICRTLIAASLISGAAQPASADPPPYVVLEAEQTIGGVTAAQEVTSELQAAMRRNGIGVSATPRREPPGATIRLRTLASGVRVSIDIVDSITVKRVGRDLDLSSIPLKDRAHFIAVATEELLRASWVELAMDRTAQIGFVARASPAPDEVRGVVEQSLARSSSVQHWVGGRAALDLYSRGVQAWGGDIGYELWTGARLGLGLMASVRSMPEQRFTRGSVSGTSWGGSAQLWVSPWGSRERWILDFSVGARMAATTFRGHSTSEQVQAEDIALPSFALCTSSRAGILVGQLFHVTVDGCRVLRGAEARDSGQRLTSQGGWMLGMSVGVMLH